MPDPLLPEMLFRCFDALMCNTFTTLDDEASSLWYRLKTTTATLISCLIPSRNGNYMSVLFLLRLQFIIFVLCARKKRKRDQDIVFFPLCSSSLISTLIVILPVSSSLWWWWWWWWLSIVVFLQVSSIYLIRIFLVYEIIPYLLCSLVSA